MFSVIMHVFRDQSCDIITLSLCFIFIFNVLRWCFSFLLIPRVDLGLFDWSLNPHGDCSIQCKDICYVLRSPFPSPCAANYIIIINTSICSLMDMPLTALQTAL
eukprot:78579_1